MPSSPCSVFYDTRVEASILNLDPADVHMAHNLAVNGHILTNQKPEIKTFAFVIYVWHPKVYIVGSLSVPVVVLG